MFNTLYDLCETVGLDVGIRCYDKATRTTPAVLGIEIYTEDNNKICEWKMGEPDDPTLDDLSEYVINDLKERGFFDTAASS